MSSHSYTSTCPKCDSETMSVRDNRPYDKIYHECLSCGWYSFPQEGQSTLKDVNVLRAEQDLKPLKRLKKQI